MDEHRLEVFALVGAIGASCSCGGWTVPVLADGVDYRPVWEAHLSHSVRPENV